MIQQCYFNFAGKPECSYTAAASLLWIWQQSCMAQTWLGSFMGCVRSLEVTSAECMSVCLTCKPFWDCCVGHCSWAHPRSLSYAILPAFPQLNRALPAELPIKAGAVKIWQWLSSFSYRTESSLTWKGKRGPCSDADVIFCDRQD